MPWKGGERPRKSWKSCAAFWMSTRGAPDEKPCDGDFAGTTPGPWLDTAPLRMAGSGARRAVCRREHGVPANDDALRAGGDYAGVDDGGPDDYFHGPMAANGSGR